MKTEIMVIREILHVLRRNWHYKLKLNFLCEILVAAIKSEDRFSDFSYKENYEKEITPKDNLTISNLLSGKILYIKILYFESEYHNTWKERFEKFGCTNCCFIIDLRNCQGGSVDSALSLCHTILPKNSFILENKGNKQEIELGDDNNQNIVYCLVSENTISSGELVAGLIKEYSLGSVIGENKTFGKNIIQKKFKVNSGELKISIGKFIFKQLGDIENNGIIPNIIMERYTDCDFERLGLKKEICECDNNTNVYVLQKILNQITEKEVPVNGICNNVTLEAAKKILGKDILDKITPNDLVTINYKYASYFTRIQNDNQIKYILNKLSEDKKNEGKEEFAIL